MAASREIDPQVMALIAELNGRFPALGTEVLEAAEARRQLAELRKPPAEPTPVAAVREEEIAGGDGEALRLRRYLPPEPLPGAPKMVYLHGGGWVIGDLDSHDELARKLTAGSGVELVSVAYRLAPEHPFPAALEDTVAAFAHVAAEPGLTLIGGDSAGGNLAIAAATVMRDRGGPTPAGLLLMYPVADGGCETPSFAENGEGFYVTADHLGWFWDQYAADPASREDPLASPLRADLAGLPPTHIVTAELDPLRDEGEALGARLVEAGVPTEVRRYPAFHGFLVFDALLSVAREGVADCCAALRALAGGDDG